MYTCYAAFCPAAKRQPEELKEKSVHNHNVQVILSLIIIWPLNVCYIKPLYYNVCFQDGCGGGAGGVGGAAVGANGATLAGATTFAPSTAQSSVTMTTSGAAGNALAVHTDFGGNGGDASEQPTSRLLRPVSGRSHSRQDSARSSKKSHRKYKFLTEKVSALEKRRVCFTVLQCFWN